MQRGPGRDQRGPMERLVSVLYLLSQFRAAGCPVPRILALGLYHGTDESQREQLARDVGHLRALGWEIDNVAGAGTDAVYRLVAHDHRLMLEFTADERVELYRCARMARLDEVAADLSPVVAPLDTADDLVIDGPEWLPALGEVLTAVEGRRLLHFRYFGTAREVVPRVTYDRSGTWYLVGRETGSEVQKTFRVDRMSEVLAGEAADPSTTSHPLPPRLDPLSWSWDDPVDVQVATSSEHLSRVVALLGRPTAQCDLSAAESALAEVGDHPPGMDLLLTFSTTNTAVFLHRLCQLRERVRLVGPARLRGRLRDYLCAVAGVG